MTDFQVGDRVHWVTDNDPDAHERVSDWDRQHGRCGMTGTIIEHDGGAVWVVEWDDAEAAKRATLTNERYYPKVACPLHQDYIVLDERPPAQFGSLAEVEKWLNSQ